MLLPRPSSYGNKNCRSNSPSYLLSRKLRKGHGLGLSGITDEQFWDTAEARIYPAPRAYAEQANMASHSSVGSLPRTRRGVCVHRCLLQTLRRGL